MNKPVLCSEENTVSILQEYPPRKQSWKDSSEHRQSMPLFARCRNVRDPWRIAYQHLLKAFSWLKKKVLIGSFSSSVATPSLSFPSQLSISKHFHLVMVQSLVIWTFTMTPDQGTLCHSHSTCLYSQQYSHSWHLHSWNPLLPWFSKNHMAAPSFCISSCTFLVHLPIPPFLYIKLWIFSNAKTSLWLYTLTLDDDGHFIIIVWLVFLPISSFLNKILLLSWTYWIAFLALPLCNLNQSKIEPKSFLLQMFSASSELHLGKQNHPPFMSKLVKKLLSYEMLYFQLLEIFYNILILLEQDTISTSWKTVVIKIEIYAANGINCTSSKQHHHSLTAQPLKHPKSCWWTEIQIISVSKHCNIVSRHWFWMSTWWNEIFNPTIRYFHVKKEREENKKSRALLKFCPWKLLEVKRSSRHLFHCEIHNVENKRSLRSRFSFSLLSLPDSLKCKSWHSKHKAGSKK